MANLAAELGTCENRRQLVILTHQPRFADLLESHGAERRRLGRWEGGRHHPV